jgi:hypothetical protein
MPIHLDRLEKLVKIQRYHVERFADFVAKLAATPDGEGTLLDNSMLLYGSNMSNSNVHSNYPLPNILVGGGAGALKRGTADRAARTHDDFQSAPHAA